jgi:uracil-DNA glycosylase family 4
MDVYGDGEREILIVGEYPSEYADEDGLPFAGDTLKHLKDGLKQAGIDYRRDCWITNSLLCSTLKNRDPTSDELQCCLPNLINTIRVCKPRVIVLMGRAAISQVIGQFWEAGIGGGFRWLGWKIPCIEWNAWLCPTYHPAFINKKLKGDEIEGLLWKQNLKEVGRLEGRPWSDGPPNHASKIKCIYDPDKAASEVDKFTRAALPTAFDYECDRLKPDHPDARIVSCSMSNGEYAISFPWVGTAVEATRTFLWSTVPKMAWNMKFEERWTRKMFGAGVRNWLWDGMLATHVLDNRQEICSLKFQAFVQMGVSSYNTSVAPYLKADSGNLPNRIKEVDLGELLFYGGMDSLCTAIIGLKQIMEVDP